MNVSAPLLQAELVTDIEELESLSEPWRELAHSCSCPGALPDWQLAWWRHLAPEGALLRAVAVYEGDRLMGLAPFYVSPGWIARCDLLGAGMTHRVSPLALPGRECEVAGFIASTLARSDPRPDLVALEAVDADSPWPEAIREAWPSRLRPWRYSRSLLPAPIIELEDGGFDSWFASRSKKFREEMRRARRRAESEGGRIVLAENGGNSSRAVDEFLRLHLARRSERGGSSLTSEWSPMLKEAASAMAPRGEMRLWTLEVDGKLAAVNLMLAAGGVLAGFNIGIDKEFARFEPGHLTALAAIEDAFERGETRLDTGGGDSPYKRRLTSKDAPIYWTGVVPRSTRYPLVRAHLALAGARLLATRAAQKLPQAWQKRIKRVLRRG